MRISILPFVALCACTTPGASTDSDPTPELPRRALVLGIDGVRADLWEPAALPAFDRTFASGALSLQTSTQLTAPTVSGPGWASILTGVESEVHRVLDNSTLVDRVSPTFPALLQDAGHPAAVVAHWTGIATLVGVGNVDELRVLPSDAEVGAEIAAVIQGDTADLVFAHFDDVDAAGHATGFTPENPDYVAALERADLAATVALDLVAADDQHQWLVIVCTDHGGSGTGHGALDAENRTVPQAMSGTGVVVPAAPSHLDVATTVLSWFGHSLDGQQGHSWLADGT